MGKFIEGDYIKGSNDCPRHHKYMCDALKKAVVLSTSDNDGYCDTMDIKILEHESSYFVGMKNTVHNSTDYFVKWEKEQTFSKTR